MFAMTLKGYCVSFQLYYSSRYLERSLQKVVPKRVVLQYQVNQKSVSLETDLPDLLSRLRLQGPLPWKSNPNSLEDLHHSHQRSLLVVGGLRAWTLAAHARHAETVVMVGGNDFCNTANRKALRLIYDFINKSFSPCYDLNLLAGKGNRHHREGVTFNEVDRGRGVTDGHQSRDFENLGKHLSTLFSVCEGKRGEEFPDQVAFFWVSSDLWSNIIRLVQLKGIILIGHDDAPKTSLHSAQHPDHLLAHGDTSTRIAIPKITFFDMLHTASVWKRDGIHETMILDLFRKLAVGRSFVVLLTHERGEIGPPLKAIDMGLGAGWVNVELVQSESCLSFWRYSFSLPSTRPACEE